MTYLRKLVSILMPYYNDQRFLESSIRSVLNSTYENFELILINHASTDQSRAIAHSFNDHRIRHFDFPVNYGAGGGVIVNQFVRMAKGEYLKFFCADDILHINGLQKLVTYLDENPTVDIAFGNLEYIDANGLVLNDTWFSNRFGFDRNEHEEYYIRKYIEGVSALPWVGSIVRRNVIQQISLDMTYVMMFDMSIWLSLLCRGCKMGIIDDIVARYRVHEAQVSSRANEEKALQLSYFESKSFWQIFLQMKDVALVKRIWPNSALNPFLTKVDDIPFVVAYNLFKEAKFTENSVIALQNFLNSRPFYYERVLHYGIKEFREDQLSFLKHPQTVEKPKHFLKKIKTTIRSTQPTELSIFQLIFLLIRKVIILPKTIFQKSKRKEDSRYTV